LEILKKEGLAGLYAGLESSIAGIAVTNTVFYLFRECTLFTIIKTSTLTRPASSIVEESKRIILGRVGTTKPSTGQMMLASTIAGQ
jgi:adenine nucleotide transporter 17